MLRLNGEPIMKTMNWRQIAFIVPVLAVLPARQPSALGQEGPSKTWRVPVLMEESTVRGKVVVLETRREDRKAVENLLIQVWTAPDEEAEANEQVTEGAEAAKGATEPAEPGDSASEPQEPKLVHETRTDENGLFSLPVLGIGTYRLVVGEISVQLRVLPKAKEREGQEEPKILLILLPKEVVG